MSDELTIWIENSIAGFLYSLAGSFLFLFFGGIKEFPDLVSLKEYLPYIFLGLIAFFSIMGYSAQVVLQCIISIIRPESKYNAEEEKRITLELQETLKKRLHNLYVVLILYRHLIIGTSFIWISLLFWLSISSDNSKYCYYVSIISILLITIFIITYILHRKKFNAYKDATLLKS